MPFAFSGYKNPVSSLLKFSAIFPTSEQDLTVLVSAAYLPVCLIPRPEECLEMSTKAPNPVDKYVGSRVRMRRIMLGMSQEKLGEALGLTFQQIQKYEKGTNRVGASRIQQISEILQVPVSFLFEGGPSGTANADGFGEGTSPAYVSDFLATSEGLALTRAFTRITDAKLRRSIVDLVEQIAARESAEKASG
jgi:transcriptional regulator with XRE-family HTH domain